MQTLRCGHFQLEVEQILVPGAPVVLRVPVRRCLLAEHMIGLIGRTDQGTKIARQLRIQSSAEAPEAAAEEAVRAAFGPDLEAIHPLDCTVQRCRESCSPGFKIMASQFGFDAEAQAETGAGCLDPTQAAAETSHDATAHTLP